MPPKGVGLSAEEIGILKRWIEQGAVWPDALSGEGVEAVPYWMLPPVPPILPEGTPPGTHPIDAFIDEGLRRQGLVPGPEADRWTLARRASLATIGLPPTYEEARDFVEDRRPAAYEHYVDGLLQRDAYGERWALVWMDLARYADSAGYGSDPLRPFLWRWRDWVIEAFRRNMPFDQFTIEQLAGDLLDNPTVDQRLATAFHRNTMTNTEGGTDDEEFRIAAVKDRIETTAQVWLGLTLGCAECHSHKFDPISHKDYYRVFAVFNQTKDRDQPDEEPRIWTPTETESRGLMVAAKQAMAASGRLIAGLTNASPAARGLSDHNAALHALHSLVRSIVRTPVLEELAPSEVRVTRVLEKGSHLAPGDVVSPGALNALNPWPEDQPRNRLGFARWLVDPRNPLFARVAVNRLWAQLFGRGLVATEEDFGSQGSPPTHKELLDWLAIAFRSNGFDQKDLLRQILLSKAFRRSGEISDVARARDPRGVYLGHFKRERLGGEFVRDAALKVSQLLHERIGGPSVFPPQPDGLWQAAFNGERTYPTSSPPECYRRSLYTFWRRSVPPPMLQVFDAPSRETCTARRQRTNSALQALALQNEPTLQAAHAAFASRALARHPADLDARARWLLQEALIRPAREEEVDALLHFAEESTTLSRTADSNVNGTPSEVAIWTGVAGIVMNSDAFQVQR